MMAGNLVLGFILSASLNQLLTMINTMQLVVMLPLFKITVPANAGMFFSQIMQIAAFDFFETGPYIDALLGLPPSEPLNANFEAVGFESLYLLHNMGTLFIAFVAYFTLVLLAFFCQYICCCERVKYFGENLRKKLFFGSFIQIIFESYSILAVSCFINLTRLSWSPFGEVLMSLTTIGFLILLLAFPFGYGTYIWKNFNRFNVIEFFEKHSEFYKELNMRHGPMVLLQPIWFLVRRLVLATIVVFLGQTAIWQIALMTLTVITQVIILGRVEPFVDKNKMYFEFFSETIVMLVMYTLICFTPFLPDLEMRFRLGYICIGIISVHLLVSLFILGKGIFKDVRFANSRWRSLKAHKAIRDA